MSASAEKLKIMIVDDHPILADGLTSLINMEKDMTVVAQANDCSQAMDKAAEFSPDVCLIDITIGGENGIDLTKKISDKFPDTKVVILSMHEERLYAAAALQAGACGYVRKVGGYQIIIHAIRTVAGGQIYLDSSLSAEILKQAMHRPVAPTDKLSDREKEVFALLGQGLTNNQIAERSFISIKTVETYITRIREKLEKENTASLRQMAIEQYWSKKS